MGSKIPLALNRLQACFEKAANAAACKTGAQAPTNAIILHLLFAAESKAGALRMIRLDQQNPTIKANCPSNRQTAMKLRIEAKVLMKNGEMNWHASTNTRPLPINVLASVSLFASGTGDMVMIFTVALTGIARQSGCNLSSPS